MICDVEKAMKTKYFFIEKEGQRIIFEPCLIDELLTQLHIVKEKLR